MPSINRSAQWCLETCREIINNFFDFNEDTDARLVLLDKGLEETNSIAEKLNIHEYERYKNFFPSEIRPPIQVSTIQDLLQVIHYGLHTFPRGDSQLYSTLTNQFINHPVTGRKWTALIEILGLQGSPDPREIFANLCMAINSLITELNNRHQLGKKFENMVIQYTQHKATLF